MTEPEAAIHPSRWVDYSNSTVNAAARIFYRAVEIHLHRRLAAAGDPEAEQWLRARGLAVEVLTDAKS